MIIPRVIPCLLVSGSGLVKTTRFRKPKYVGDPINAIKIFNDKRVDELVILDIDASKTGAGPNYALIESIASECFMPVCYGGGVASAADAKAITGIGIEKIAVNSAALADPRVIGEIAQALGSQSVVAAVDLKKNLFGHYRVYDSARRKPTAIHPSEHIRTLVAHGAGEVFINFVDNDGVQSGYDLRTVQELVSLVDVPVIACGGAGSLEHLRGVTQEAGAAAAAAGSLFVFNGPHRAVLISYPSRNELVELFRKAI